MKNYGLVSIITPTYNSATFIERTIEAIIAQTYSNWELLITDDYSTDNTCKIIERYAENDKRIKLLKLTANSGAGVARNNSIAQAQGRYIAFCDSDDCWYPNKLAKQLAFMEKKNCALSYTSYLRCDENNNEKGIIICKKKETLFSLKCNNGIGCSTAVYDTQRVGKLFMPLLQKRQDWGLWMKVLQKCQIAYGIKEPLTIYRVRPNSLSQQKTSLIKYNQSVYKEVLGWSSVRAVLFFWFVFTPTYLTKKLGDRYINR